MADGSVLIDTELDQSGLKKGLANMAGTVASGITKAIAAAGTALAGLGTYAISVGSDFEYAISGVAATMGKTKDEIKDIEMKARELGASTKFTATEAAEGFNILAQAGLDVDEQLAAIGATLDLASAGEMSMDAAAGYLTTTIKAMSASTREANLSMDDAARVADLYAKGAVLAKTTTADFGDAMSKTAAMAGSYNQSLESTGAALLALADGGYTGSAAGTYLSRAMSDLYAPSKNAQAALEALGVSAYDEAGNAKDLIDVVEELQAATAGMTEEERNATNATIFTSAGLKAYNTMVSQGTDKLREFSKELENSTGAAQAMAETKLDNLQGDITILKSATEGFGIAMYDAMTNVEGGANVLRDFVQEATDIMSELTDAVNEGGFEGLVDAIGGALSRAVTKIVEYIPMFVEGGVNIVSSLVQGLADSAGTIADSAASVLDSLIGGFLSITTDLVELGGELIIALCNGLAANAGNIANTIAEGLVGLQEKIVEYIPQLIEAGISLLTAIVDGIVGAAPTLVNAIPGILNSLITTFTTAVPRLVEAGKSMLMSVVDGILAALPTLIAAVPEILTAIVEALQEAIPTLLDCITEVIEAIVEALPDLITALVDALPDLIQTIVDALVELIPLLIECVSNAVLAIVEALPEIIMAILEVLPTIVQSICDGLMELLPQLIEAGISLLTALIQDLPTIINTIVLALPQIINSIVSTLLGMIPTIVDCGVQLLVSLVQALPDIIYAIVSVLPTIIASIVSTLVGMIPTIVQCGIDLLVSLVKALPEIIIAIVAAIPQIIDSIIRALIDSIPLIIQCGIDLLVSLIAALPDIIISIVQALPEIITSIINALLDNIPLIIQAGVDLFMSLITNLPTIIIELVKAIPKIISSLVDALGQGVAKFAEVGGNLVRGLWDGIQGLASWIWDKVSGWISGIWDGICDFFGISSPSKLFKNMLGKNLMLGLAEGITENGEIAVDAALDVADEVAGVEFDLDKPELDTSGIDYDGLIANAKGTIEVEGANTGTSISAGSTESTYVRGNEPNDGGDKEQEERKPEYVQNDIYIDGKQAARVMTPYVAKELEWEDK